MFKFAEIEVKQTEKQKLHFCLSLNLEVVIKNNL